MRYTCLPKTMKWIILFLSATALASAGVLKQPSQLLRSLHMMMSADELSRTFSVDNSSQVGDYEVVYIRRHQVFEREDPYWRDIRPMTKRNEPQDNYAHYSFAANGKKYDLKVRPNNFLMAPNMKTVVRSSRGLNMDIVEEHPIGLECHFLQIDGGLVAALSHCTEDDIHGYVIDGGKSMEIRPIPPRLRQMLHPASADYNEIIMVGAHILRVVDPFPHLKAHQTSCDVDLPIRLKPMLAKENILVESELKQKLKTRPQDGNDAADESSHGSNKTAREKSITGRSARNKVLELGIFVDHAAIGLFMPYLGVGEYVKLRELVLGFVNAMQALYHLPSLGQRIDLSIVYMEFQEEAPVNLVSSGEQAELLDSFCTFQENLNKPSDDEAGHWDMALLLSGHDFYTVENGKHNYVPMGLSTVTGVCTNSYNCVIGEFGVPDPHGQPYPSTGFTSAYIMAHEIGHNLGISHDSSGNNCPSDGFIMSPDRSLVGEVTWSTCSAKMLNSITETCMNDVPSGNISDYNHNKYGDHPGQLWTADEQCRILLKDKAAVAYFAYRTDIAKSCSSLRCRTPNRNGIFTSGPALPGTTCGPSMWCYQESCVPKLRSGVIPSTQGGWSDWRSKPCSSGCLQKSNGIVANERECNNPKPNDMLHLCVGASVKAATCDDAQVCNGKSRITPVDFAGQQCAKFSEIVPFIDSKGIGMQAAYSDKRLWQSCAIFCKRNDRDGFYTPRLDLNSLLDVSAYFPDGTWCGNDGQKDLYCLQRSCVFTDVAEGLIRSVVRQDTDLDLANETLKPPK